MNHEDKRIEFVSSLLKKPKKDVAKIILTKSSEEMKLREQVFEKIGINCSCLVGFVVCQFCEEYYNNIDALIQRHEKIQAIA